jgi:hypothetical protein
MENESRAIAYIISVSLLVGIMVGAILINSRFQRDTYDCTVKCPNMAHSIYVDEKCYCEVK